MSDGENDALARSALVGEGAHPLHVQSRLASALTARENDALARSA